MNAPKTAQNKRGPKRTRAAVSPLAERVGRTLEKLRAGEPLEKLAEDLGTSQQALSQWETGQIPIDSAKAKSTFVALARYFQHDLDLAWLRPYVNLSRNERGIILRLARESGRSFESQLYALVLEALASRELIDDNESAA